METTTSFVFSHCAFNQTTGVVTLKYILQGEEFVEILHFPTEGIRPDLDIVLLNDALLNLHLAGGMSYWKLTCAPRFEILSGTLSLQQAIFWNTLYTKGLGEFYYKNQIDFRDLVQFPYDNTYIPVAREYVPVKGTLLPIGGGKDSIVTAELLLKHEIPFDPIMLYRHEPILKTAEILGKRDKTLIIDRALDPKIHEWNLRSDTFNGHVPITAYINFVFLFAAILYGYEYTAWSLEKSASEGQLDYLSMNINHQYSKSEEFEELLKTYIHTYITPSYTPFSTLRGVYELAIGKQYMSLLTEAKRQGRDYAPFVTSCNKAFKIYHEKHDTLWCGACPKCAFVGLILAPFCTEQELYDLMGVALFEQKALIDDFLGLAGVGDYHKPFECVGTIEESLYAFALLDEQQKYQETPIMKAVKEHIPNLQSALFREQEQRLLTWDSSVTLPRIFQAITKDFTVL